MHGVLRERDSKKWLNLRASVPLFTKERVLGLQKMLNHRKATRKYIEGANGRWRLSNVTLCRLISVPILCLW